MMIVKVREVAERLGIKNAAQLASFCGLGLTTAYNLWAGEVEMLSMETLNRLCSKLQAGPSLLLEYRPDFERGSDEGPTLQEIITRRRGGTRGSPKRKPGRSARPRGGAS